MEGSMPQVWLNIFCRQFYLTATEHPKFTSGSFVWLVCCFKRPSPADRFTPWPSPLSNTMSSLLSPVPVSFPKACPNSKQWNEPNMRRARQSATLLWLTPPPLSCAPHTRKPANPNIARACMRTPMLAGPQWTTAPILFPEAHLCWDVPQTVLFYSFYPPVLAKCHKLTTFFKILGYFQIFYLRIF